MSNIFLELTVIIAAASVLSIIFRLIKQPAILAYILTGILIGPFGNFQFQNREILQTMGELGIAFLLFMIGLELRFIDLKSVGKISLVTGTIQTIVTFVAGFFLSQFLGFGQIISVFLGASVSFSSTIIVVKLLSDKKDLQSLYGKISVGVLLVQDLFAVLLLIFLSNLSSEISPENIAGTVAKSLVLLLIVLLLSAKVFPKILDKIAGSSETLFLFSIAWALSFSALVSSIGFSIGIGGLLAGLALANTAENYQIIGKTKSLRDFFITIFFVFLGMSMSFTSFSKIIIPALVLSVFVLLFKPLIIALIMGVFGYRKRTSFLTAISLSQISEFSLILIFLGGKTGYVSPDVVSLVTAVALITFAFSNYIILGSSNLYRFIGSKMFFLERKQGLEEYVGEEEGHKDHVVLIGAARTGGSVLSALIDQGEKVLVVDFNPDVIKNLKNRKIKSLFGDISDSEIQDRAGLKNARLIISTVSDIDDNLLLISGIKKLKKKPRLVAIAQNDGEEEELKKAGVNYVIQPHVLGGRHLAHLINTNSL